MMTKHFSFRHYIMFYSYVLKLKNKIKGNTVNVKWYVCVCYKSTFICNGKIICF